MIISCPQMLLSFYEVHPQWDWMINLSLNEYYKYTDAKPNYDAHWAQHVRHLS